MSRGGDACIPLNIRYSLSVDNVTPWRRILSGTGMDNVFIKENVLGSIMYSSLPEFW